MTTLEVYAQQIVNGVSVGMMYAVFAIGFTLIYGIMELINFSHFSIFVVGGFVGLELLSLAGGASLTISEPKDLAIVLAAMLAAMLASGIVGSLVERLLRPLRGRGGTAPLIATVGISFVLMYGIMLLKGPQNFPYPAVIPQSSWEIAGVQVRLKEIVVWGASLLGLLGLYVLVWKTQIGRAMRATRDDLEAAEMMGVETKRIIAVTFFASSALAGLAGMIFGVYYGQINFFSGYSAGMRAFTAAVLGGIGNPVGCVLGALMLGLLESVGGQLIGVRWTQIFVFGALIATLIFLPTGFLGTRLGRRA